MMTVTGGSACLLVCSTCKGTVVHSNVWYAATCCNKNKAAQGLSQPAVQHVLLFAKSSVDVSPREAKSGNLSEGRYMNVDIGQHS